MPTTLGKTTPPGWTSPDQAKEQTDAARRRAQKNQSQRRKRAELTPSNKDLDKAQNTQSKRRRRAELSPEDKDQANAERRVKRRFDKDSPDQAKEQTDAARRRARQSIREFELIWLLQQRLRAQCLGLTGACAACSHCTATAWELSDLDHSHAATPQRVTRASCVRLLRSVLGAACR